MSEIESPVRVLKSSSATRGIGGDAVLTMEPRRASMDSIRVDPETYLACITVRATSTNGEPFAAPRLELTGIDRLTREDWERLDRAVRRLFAEYDRVFEDQP